MAVVARRTKFLIATLIYLIGCFLFEFIKFDKYIFIGLFVFVVVITNLIALYPGYKLKDIFYISFQPLIISASTIAGLVYFPNLNIIFKILLIVTSGLFMYIATLTNNLVIAEKIEDSSLPLFRVGLIWTQILLIIQSIPLITVIYKIDIPFYIQLAVISIYFAMASLIYLHTLYLSRKGEKVNKFEYYIQIAQMTYLPIIAGIATSFTPAESFLRATFITTVYMGMVGYIRNYVENSLTKTLIYQYAGIVLFFFIVLFIFSL